MEIRNPRFNARGSIDCEINHPEFGWIPFTADPNDDAGAAIHAAALSLDPVAYATPAPDPANVNRERDRRLSLPFSFAIAGQTHIFDRTPISLQRITGAATLAGFAIAAGAQPGNLLWHGGQSPFSWITAENVTVQMDAQTTFALGKEAAAVETRIIFAAFALKGMDPIPDDYASDGHWP